MFQPTPLSLQAAACCTVELTGASFHRPTFAVVTPGLAKSSKSEILGIVGEGLLTDWMSFLLPDQHQ